MSEKVSERVIEILKEDARKAEEIIEEAKANGTWQMGLDSNNALFEELKAETFEKLKALDNETIVPAQNPREQK